MFENFSANSLGNSFIPHGFCINWTPELLSTYVLSDGLIFFSYFAISSGLIYFLRRRPRSELTPIMWLFAAFILACGMTHLSGLLTIWRPYYFIDALIKLLTAMISVTTVVYLWPQLPNLLKLPNPDELIRLNQQLSDEIEQRTAAQALLSVSEQRWKFALESGGDGVWDWDLETGKSAFIAALHGDTRIW
ncbi:hypothetical protein [Methylocucumis oryzae]|uniref:Ethylene receptor 1-like N-terminal domain-containing protein n=1 Tax=Methylocucumis oryzae TaxID=1632867 RepID=A0A0F3IIY8_9GAMM|nr:hypothetical protein [Methylocucumis oryzae]KJV06701.1 hypothetical protein VZ94_09595 [Methylocucumis oryzae]